ncbi:hypothetical protein PPYR_00738 [Photinus pyralis]|uniref:DDE-1 domain-containing protein n=1 Tax=Photinus pyralis TaxID=7054 RepID=A0A5N4B2L8_PHOPY|nr:hypothetical protein PPYR_00738 [Photinus pyralis]
MNKNIVKDYFLLKNILEGNNLFNNPSNIYNMDESVLQLNNRSGEVIAGKGSKVVTAAEKGETITKSAYINSDIFLEWLKTHFLPRKPAGKVLLLLDGHASHCNSIETRLFADEHDIILLCLPPHTTHYLQPFNSIFQVIKTWFLYSGL